MHHFPISLFPLLIIIDDFSSIFPSDSSFIQPTTSKLGPTATRQSFGYSPRNATIVKTLALLQETVVFLSKQRLTASQNDSPCADGILPLDFLVIVDDHLPSIRFLISETLPQDASLRNYFLYSNWIPLVFLITDSPPLPIIPSSHPQHPSSEPSDASTSSSPFITAHLPAQSHVPVSTPLLSKSLIVHQIHGQVDPLQASASFATIASNIHFLSFHSTG